MPVTLLDQDGDAVEACIRLPAGDLTVIARVRLQDDRVVLYDLHITGPGPGRVGIAQLRAAVLEIMDAYNVGLIEIRGFARTTGAGPGPGRVPRPLVFRRR